MKEGKTFEEALRTRTFEPDAPNYTPRISGVVRLKDGFSYQLSILKSANGNPDSVQRFFFDYAQPESGVGRFIHTYRCDGSPIPSFEGEPIPVTIEGDLEAFTSSVWESLNEDNKVSLFTRFIDLETGSSETRIVNKNHKEESFYGKRLMLKYGCNPNQKPSKSFYEGSGGSCPSPY